MSRNRRRNGTRGRVTRKIVQEQKITKDMLKSQLLAMGFSKESSIEPIYGNEDSYCVRNGLSSRLENSFWNPSGNKSENVVAFNFLIGSSQSEEVSKRWSVENIDSDVGHNGEIGYNQSATSVTGIATENDDKSLYNSGVFDYSPTNPFVETSSMFVSPEPESDISNFDCEPNLESQIEFEEKCDPYFCTTSSCIETKERLSSEEIERYFKNISLCSYQPTVRLAYLTEDVICSFSTRTISEGEADDENQAESDEMSGARVPPLKLRLRGSHWRVNDSGEPLAAPLVPALPGVVAPLSADVSSESAVESSISYVETDDVSLKSLQNVSHAEGIETSVEQCLQPAMFNFGCNTTENINCDREGFPVATESQEENNFRGIIDDVNTGEIMETGKCFPSFGPADSTLSQKTEEDVERHRAETEQEMERSLKLTPGLCGGAEAVEKVDSVLSAGCSSETLLCDSAPSQTVSSSPTVGAKADDSGHSPDVELRFDPISPSQRFRRASLRPRKRPPLKSVDKPVVKRLGTRIFRRPRRGMLSQRDQTVVVESVSISVSSSSPERRRAVPAKDVYQFDDAEFDAPLRYFRRISRKRQPMKPVVICVQCGIEKAFVARSIWDRELVPEGWCLSCNLLHWASKAPVMTRPQKPRKLRGLLDASAGHRSLSLEMLQTSIEPRARGRPKSQRKKRWRSIKKQRGSNWSSRRSYTKDVSPPVNGSMGKYPSTSGSLDGDSPMSVVVSRPPSTSTSCSLDGDSPIDTVESLHPSTSTSGSLEGDSPMGFVASLHPSTSTSGPFDGDSPVSIVESLRFGLSKVMAQALEVRLPTTVAEPLEVLPTTVSGSFKGSPSTSVSGVLGEGPFQKVNESAEDRTSGTALGFLEDTHGAENRASSEAGRDQVDKTNDPSDEAIEDYSCLWCGEEFSSPGELDAHSLSHAEPPDENFLDDSSSSSKECICCRSASVANGSCSHSVRVTKEMDTNPNHMSSGPSHDDAPSASKEFSCPSLSAAKSTVVSASELSVIPHHSSETIIFGTGQASFKCLHCLLSFPTASSRRAHVISEHAQEVSITCSLCDYISGSQHRHEHHCAVSHSVFRFKCPMCSDLFMSSQLLTLHQFCNHKLQHERFFCPICNISSYSPCNVTKHIRTVHEGCLPFSCWCGQSYDDLFRFKIHSEVHAKELFKLHCDVCFLWCPTKELLEAHFALKHSGLSPYCCPSCDKSYSSLKILSRHVKKSHPKLVEYACRGCALRFPTPLMFWNHITTKGHMVEEVAFLYKCRECDITSFDRMKIAEHEETVHTGVVPVVRAAELFSLVREVL